MRDDPELTHAVIHALNQWIHEEWSFDYEDRIFTTPDHHAADRREGDRGAGVGASSGAPRSCSSGRRRCPGYGGSRSPGFEEFDPFWQAVVDADVLVAMHASDSGYARYQADWTGPAGDAAVQARRLPDDDPRSSGRSRTRWPPWSATARSPASPTCASPPSRTAATGSSRSCTTWPTSTARCPTTFDEDPIEAFRRNVWVSPFHEDDIERADRRHRRRPRPLRLGLPAPRGPGRAVLVRRPPGAPPAGGRGQDHGRQPRRHHAGRGPRHRLTPSGRRRGDREGASTWNHRDDRRWSPAAPGGWAGRRSVASSRSGASRSAWTARCAFRPSSRGRRRRPGRGARPRADGPERVPGPARRGQRLRGGLRRPAAGPVAGGGPRGHEGKRAKTLHTVFARGASPDAPLDIAVEPMHAGRAFASTTVTISQGDRLCTRSLVLLTADEPDLIRHADPAPAVAPPRSTPTARRVGGPDRRRRRHQRSRAHRPARARRVDAVPRGARRPDDRPGPPRLRHRRLPHRHGHAAARRRRPGPGPRHADDRRGRATRSRSTSPSRPRDWLLLSHHSPYAGRGRSYGRADVFRTDGALVASYVQDAMIRPRSTDQKGAL